MLNSSVQHKLLSSLPDDRPITSLLIVENLEKCPKGFTPIRKTYDQDQNADLRESSIFKYSSARYLCVSKAEGIPGFVVGELFIISDKHNLPKGFSLLNRTIDTEQKTWKKKQLCYRLVNIKEAKLAITDIIICNRLKKAPEGFKLAGELNGVTICFKMGNVQDSGNNHDANGRPKVYVSPNPSDRPLSGVNPMYPSLGNGGDHDYEILKPPGPAFGGTPTGPSRPAPRPPPPVPHQSSTTSMGTTHNLDGVPFIVNPKFLTSSTANRIQFPVIRAKTMEQILKEYDYPFTVERQT